MAAVVDHTLTWTKPRLFKSNYELRFGDELLATLRFQRIFRSAAIAEGEDGCWIFDRRGILKRRTIVRLCGSSTTAATFRKNTWKEGGRLELSDGRTFTVIASLWKHSLEIQTDAGETLIQMNSRGVFRPSAKVQMYRTCLHVPEFPWMVMLGWYLIIMMKRDAAARRAHG